MADFIKSLFSVHSLLVFDFHKLDFAQLVLFAESLALGLFLGYTLDSHFAFVHIVNKALMLHFHESYMQLYGKDVGKSSWNLWSNENRAVLQLPENVSMVM